MSAVARRPQLTPEEYLGRERSAQIKHEFFHGALFAMAGGSYAHSLICGNLHAEVRAGLSGRPCAAHASDLRVKVSATGLYTYPDLSVVCGEPHFDDGHRDTLLNPIVIGEVLSPSIEAYDRGDKFEHYQRIESLQEYLLVSQDRIHVEHFVRQGEKWVLSTIRDLDEILVLPAINCRISLSQIYDRVEFPAAGQPPPHPPGPSPNPKS